MTAAEPSELAYAAFYADCALHAAIVHISEEGTADYVYGGYRAGRYGHHDDDIEAEFDEVLDGRYWLDSWAGMDGDRPEFGEVALDREELLPVGALDGASPDEQWVHESSGNAGVTVERAYRHAALVIWPGPRTLHILTGENIARAVAWVRSRMARDRAAGCALLARLIGAWPPTARRAGGLKDDARARREVLDLLADAGDPALASRFLNNVLQAKFDGSENDSLLDALALIAPRAAAEWLAGLAQRRFSRRPRAVLQLLVRVGETPGFGWRDTLSGSVRATVAALPETLDSPPNEGALAWTPDRRSESRRQRIGDAAIGDLMILTWRCGLPEEAEAAAAAIAASSGKAMPERTIPASLKILVREEGLSGSDAYRSLWRRAANALLSRSAESPEAPQDWIVPADLGCDCEPCGRLAAFCADPDARIGRFPFRKELRRHLHRQIDRHCLDMSHVTERRGSPYTLVCTKNRASHKRRLKEYAEDVDWMRELTRILPSAATDNAVAALLRRLEGAIAAAG